MDKEIYESYTEDTYGKKVRVPIVSPPKMEIKQPQSPVTSANVYKRMDKKTFGRLSDDTKRQYIESLHERYGANRKEIASCLGYHEVSFSALCKGLGVSKWERRDKTPEQRKEWAMFLDGGKPDTKIGEPKEAPVEETPKQTEPTFACDKINLELNGAYDPSVLVQYILSMCGTSAFKIGTPCKVTISIEKQSSRSTEAL